MKILRISLHNIASLAGTHTVDFTREPLRTAGLFSISGPTGSGKSTLLDALCLALYERTPRLHGVRGAVKFSDRGGEITQQDPGNLLRRGTGRGFAEVAFVGVDGGTYTARWMVRRSRNQPDGSLQATEMALLRGDVQPDQQGVAEIAGRKTEVLQAIEERLGLSFKQFTRAVLLAQNDFATFLKAEDKERAEILQALTGTERFEAISKAVFVRCTDALKIVAEAEGRLTGNAPLSAEARAEAETEFANADAALKVAADRVKARQAHADWFAKLAELADAVVKAEAALQDAIALRDAAHPRRIELEQTEEISRDARPLRDAERRATDESTSAAKAWEAAAKADAESQTELGLKRAAHEAAAKALADASADFEAAKPKFVQARALDIRLPETAARLAGATQEREAAALLENQTGLKCDAHRKDGQSALDETETILKKRAALTDIAPFAPDAGTWLERLDRAAESGARFVAAVKEQKRHEKDTESRKAALEEVRAKAVALNNDASVAAAELEKLEVAMRAHDAGEISEKRRRASDAMVALQACQAHLRELAEAVSQEATMRAELATLAADQEAAGKNLADLRATRIPAAEVAYEAARSSFELAEAAVADATVALREKLIDGHACPVCGGTEHPYSRHAPGVEATALRELRAIRDKARKTRDALSNDAAAREAVCRNREAEMTAKKSGITGIISRLERLRDYRLEHPVWAEIVALAEGGRLQSVGVKLGAEALKLKAADEAEVARQSAEKRRDEARVIRDHAVNAANECGKGFAEVEAAFARSTATLEAAIATAKSAEDLNGGAMRGVASLFDAIAGSRADWERNPAAFRAAFAGRAAEWIALEKRERELADIIGRAAAALGPVEETLGRIRGELRVKVVAEATARTSHDSLKIERAALFEGRAIDSVEDSFLNRVKSSQERRDSLAAEVATAEKSRATCKEALRGAAKTQEERESVRVVATGVLDRWLAGFAERSGRAIDRAALDALLLRNEVWFRAERAALDALERSIQTIDGAIAVHRKSLESHLAARPTPDEESTVRAELPGLVEAARSADAIRDQLRAVVVADDQRRTANVALAAELEVRRIAARRWERLNDLIGSADGAKFRGIAQRRTLDILLGYANAQLAQLAPRYRLERIPESLNLIVLDRDMGDELRSVHSLSGGESFLVALALALGLAALTSSWLRIESLFIDEGFGNLDVETLNVAMGALMRLESQGRKVGVISHVSEMADAIPVQIRVAKGRGGASRLIVPGAAEPELPETLPPESLPAAASELADAMLVILRRERAGGIARTSVRALREELGCDARQFAAARESLGTRVRAEGRSIVLADDVVFQTPAPSVASS